MSIFKRRRRPLESIDDVIEIVDDLIVRHEKAKAQADVSLRMMSKALDEMERTWHAKVNGQVSSKQKGGITNA